eukprot:TRINITY_DN19041_c0_g1_i1.p1 TRINITY_DN19041_c0_g1~~TRINITY_DN19041_c0_g1_i1.p1  ORF type:complete len:294 (+),score=77.17 TRINITY_DN19041_c0_g1_i1:202-1083(+)
MAAAPPFDTSGFWVIGQADNVPDVDIHGTPEARAGQAYKRARVLDKPERNRKVKAEDVGRASAFALQCAAKALPENFLQDALQASIDAAVTPIVDAALGALEARLNTRLQDIEGRLDVIDGRVDAIAARQHNGRALLQDSTLLPPPNAAGAPPRAVLFPTTLQQLAHLSDDSVAALLEHYGLPADKEGARFWERLATHIGAPSAAGAQLAARHANLLLEDGSGVITPVPDDRHRLPAAELLPAGFTVQQLMMTVDPRLRSLLEFYGLSQQGSVEDCRDRLRKHLGVRRSFGLV